MTEKRSALRERTREVIRDDITSVAVQLFLEHGYDATTTDHIADAVGISQRSVFRYFPTKQDIVVGKFGRGVDDMMTALEARPADEPAWDSLRHMFDAATSNGGLDSYQVQRMIFETPELLSVYLRTLHDAQVRASEVLIDRAAATSTPYPPDDPASRALAAAAFGCLIAAQEMFLGSGSTERGLAPHLDRAMDAIIALGRPRPRTGRPPRAD